MRTFFLVIYLVLGYFASAQNTVANSDVSLTLNRDLYSLGYPNTWVVDTSKTLGMDVMVRSPKTDSLDAFSENLNVFVQKLNGQNYNLFKMGQESELMIKNMITDVAVIESKLDSTDSEKYYFLKFKGKHGKFTLTTIQRYYLKDEIGFAVTFTIQEGKEPEYLQLANKMFDSFRLQ